MTFELSLDTFTKHSGECFLVSCDGLGPVELELVEVEDLRDPKRKLPEHVRQDPFQLTLRGPLDPLLPQGLYTVEHNELGSVQLFIVPTGPVDGSNWYDVVIN